VTILSIPLPFIESFYLDGFRRLIITSTTAIISLVLILYFIGLDINEKKYVKIRILILINRN